MRKSSHLKNFWQAGTSGAARKKKTNGGYFRAVKVNLFLNRFLKEQSDLGKAEKDSD